MINSSVFTFLWVSSHLLALIRPATVACLSISTTIEIRVEMASTMLVTTRVPSLDSNMFAECCKSPGRGNLRKSVKTNLDTHPVSNIRYIQQDSKFLRNTRRMLRGMLNESFLSVDQACHLGSKASLTKANLSFNAYELSLSIMRSKALHMIWSNSEIV